MKTESHAGNRGTVRAGHPGRGPGEGHGRPGLSHREESKDQGHPSDRQGQVRPQSRTLPTRPNMVVLLLDDQDDFTPMWEAMPQTAAMVQDGLRFRNAFAPTPICAPGRCTFLTGRLAHNTGVFTLSGPHGPSAFGGADKGEFSVALSQLGYTNGFFGKTWGGTYPNPGWERWCAVSSNNMYTGYGYQVTDFSGGGTAGYTSGQYVTDFLADRAVGWLEKGIPANQPFLLCLAPTAPHLPLPPAPRDAAYAKHRWGHRLPHRPNHNEHDVEDKSRWLRHTAYIRSECVPYAADEYHKRMGSLMAVDDMMARVRDVLVAQGRWNNTIVFVTSDNGYNLGAHRLIHKQAPYEESIHVPLYVAGPGVASGVVNRMVGLHDLGPTFIQLAGGTAPASMDGRPIGAFLSSGSDSAIPGWRTELLTEYDSGGVHSGFNPGGVMATGWELDIPTFRSVRTETAKYILWLETGEEEVYDLVSDPFELRNLTRTDREGVGPFLNVLRAQLRGVRGCAGGSCP